MHAGDYVFRDDLQHDNDGEIGAILFAPRTVDLTARPIGPERDAQYYAAEGDRADQSVVNHVGGCAMPVMIACAEYEPEVIIDQTRRMIEALANRDSRLPMVVGVSGHNHIFVVAPIGTSDDSLGPDLIEFIRLVSQRN